MTNFILKGLTVAALIGLLLVAGCGTKTPAQKSIPVAGEAMTDPTATLDSGMQDVDSLNQLDQEAQQDVSFDELSDVNLN